MFNISDDSDALFSELIQHIAAHIGLGDDDIRFEELNFKFQNT